MATKKRVLVVGAGPSGLVSVKECLEKGFEVEAVDTKEYMGGVFGDSADSGCYEGLYLTVSNVFMAYSDFPVADKNLRYSEKQEYVEYLKDYCDHYGLLKHITLSTYVNSAKWCERARVWVVTTTTKGCAPVTKKYNAMFVCTGTNQLRHMPFTEQFKAFKGEVMHSADFKSNKSFKGKNVLVVGHGESASDIVADVSSVAASITLWTRREVVYAPRFLEANVTDPNHDEGVSLSGTQAEFKVPDFLEFITTARIGTLVSPAQFGLIRQLFWRMGPPDATNLIFKELCRASLAACNGKGLRIFCQADQAQWATKNARMCKPIAAGTCKQIIAQKIVKVNAEGFEFDTGVALKADAVICCTGYSQSWDWLEEDIGHRCPRSWFKHAFPPCFNEKPIAFIGYARPHQGGVPQLAEMVARYATMLLNEELQLPSDHAAVGVAEGKLQTEYYTIVPKLTSLVDYMSFMDSMARLIGCEPNIPWLSPSMMVKYMFYPHWSAWYRFNGPGANRKQAQRVFDMFPLKQYFRVTPIMVFNIMSYSIMKFFAPLNWLIMPKSGCDRFGAWLFLRPKNYQLHGNHMRFRDLFRP